MRTCAIAVILLVSVCAMAQDTRCPAEQTVNDEILVFNTELAGSAHGWVFDTAGREVGTFEISGGGRRHERRLYDPFMPADKLIATSGTAGCVAGSAVREKPRALCIGKYTLQVAARRSPFDVSIQTSTGHTVQVELQIPRQGGGAVCRRTITVESEPVPDVDGNVVQLVVTRPNLSSIRYPLDLNALRARGVFEPSQAQREDAVKIAQKSEPRGPAGLNQAAAAAEVVTVRVVRR